MLDTKPVPKDQRVLEIFKIFQARAAAELRRLRAEVDLRYREEKLKSLVFERSLWISGGLNVVRRDGSAFPAEASFPVPESPRISTVASKLESLRPKGGGRSAWNKSVNVRFTNEGSRY